jgi:hypothetical protein
MNTPHLLNQFAYVDRVLAKTSSVAVGDAELASYLSSYLVVMLSGVYEDCIEHLLSLRVKKTGDAEVQSYVETTLGHTFRNPTVENIVGVLRKFSDQYATSLKRRVEDRDAQAITNIVNNKNLIAHGKMSGLTLREVQDCHRCTLMVFEALEAILS